MERRVIISNGGVIPEKQIQEQREENISNYFHDTYGTEQNNLLAISAIESAQLRQTALEHCIVYGGDDLLRERFVRAIIEAYGHNYCEIRKGDMQKWQEADFAIRLNSLCPGECILLHVDSEMTSEALGVFSSALEEGVIECKIGDRTVLIDLPPFTAIISTPSMEYIPAVIRSSITYAYKINSITEELRKDIFTAEMGKQGIEVLQEFSDRIGEIQLSARQILRLAKNIGDICITKKLGKYDMVDDPVIKIVVDSYREMSQVDN